MTAGFLHRMYSTGRQDDFDQGEPDEEVCSECGEPLDDGYDWDGQCSGCADRDEEPRSPEKPQKPQRAEVSPALRGYDHDSQFMHQYDGWTDRGDQELNPDGFYPV